MEKWTRAKYLPGIPLYGDRRVTASKEHIEISRRAAEEGMVLLKNEKGILPLAAGTKAALFGKGTFDYVKGGGGSGDVTVPYIHTLYDGLSAFPGEIQIYEPLADFYRSYVQSAYAAGGLPGMIREPELSMEQVWDASAFTDTAIISISRFSGEGWDRKSSMGAAGENPFDDKKLLAAQDALFPKSDFYLSPEEEDLVNKVQANFKNIIVVLNVGGMVDSTWFKNNERIGSVLLAWQGGMEGGDAMADILLGHANPSGKLADTFAENLEDYPSTPGFHESIDHVDYVEDIYVGYRYFETIPGAAKKVNYPFGFGLSYTEFALENAKAEVRTVPTGAPDPEDLQEEDILTARVSVTNTGSVPGKEVVQLYGSAPQGLLGKPARVLAGYQKTRLLQPGETQRIAISVRINDLASYDDTGRVQKSSYVLEKGDYHFFLGTSVRDAKDLFTYTLDDNVITKRLVSRMAPTQLSMRLRSDGSFENLPMGEPNDPNDNGLQRLSLEEMMAASPAQRAVPRHNYFTDETKPQLADVAAGKMELSDFLSALSDEDLAHLLGGQPNTGVANTFGYGNLPEYGVPNIMTADGPAGLRVNRETGIRTTAFPCATLLACTWDPQVTYAVGRAGAEEVKENNICVWLTPAVNIHRSPLCGRNFEYYSEDPLLAGLQASGMVKGIQSTGVAATVKHFALNDKETNRQNSDSRASERAIREIYLKQFEIIVKTAHPWSIMTSYNIINGHRASENKDLLNGILRQEWGFDGMVTTDWWTQGEHYKECAAGNDVKMGNGFPERLLEAKEKKLLTRSQMEKAAEHILGLILRIN